MNRRTASRILAGTLAGAALAVAGIAGAQEPLKIAFVYVSPVGDAGHGQRGAGERDGQDARCGSEVHADFSLG